MTTFIISGVIITMVLFIFMNTGKEEAKGCSSGCRGCKSSCNSPSEQK